MAPLTISNYLGMLQEDPDSVQALEGLREAVKNGHPSCVGQEPIRLLEVARQGHESRGEMATVAALIACEIELVHEDPEFEAALWKELGRLASDDLLEPADAKYAYERALALRPDDSEIIEALRRLELATESWSKFAKRFVEEAEQATDLSLKTSLLVRAASLLWQFKTKGRAKEVDKLFQRALELDPAHPRAVRLYEQTLRVRERWSVLGQVLVDAAEAAQGGDERLHLYQRAARVFARRLDDKARAATCYERVLECSPSHGEALAFLVETFTEQGQWEQLVSLYEDALRVRQRIDVEEAMLLQIAMVHWRKRKSGLDAEPYFERLRKIDPAHPAMLDFYRDHLRDADDPSSWLGILSDAQRVVEDRERKLTLAIELARTAQQHASARDRCVDAWRLVQRLDPRNAEAPSVLKAIYRSTQKWSAYVEVLKAEVESVPDADAERKVALLRDLVKVYRDHLQLDVMVINTYGVLLKLVPDDREALAALAEKYEALGRWHDLIQVLTQQVRVTPDPQEKVAGYLRIAELWIERFANYNQATAPLECALALDASHQGALSELKQIYTKKRAWQALYEVLEKESRMVADPAAALCVKAEMAQLADERLQRYDVAVALWREVVTADPATAGALDALERLAERQRDTATLVEVLEHRVSTTAEGEARVKVLQKLAALYGDELNDPQQAADVWRRVLAIDPRNGRALRTLRDQLVDRADWDGLQALYADAGDWEALVDVLGSAAEKTEDPELKVALSFRAATVYETHIEEPQRAFRSYERVLSVDPSNQRAAEALAPLYRREEKWARLVGALEIQLQYLEVDGQLDVLRQLREVTLEQLRDGQAAFAFASRAYALAPGDEDVHQGLETAAERAACFESLIALYRARIDQTSDEEERVALRRRIAAIALERLGRSDLAVEAMEGILEDVPADAEAMAALERIFRDEQRFEALGKLLDHKARHVTDAGERWSVLQELARLHENVLGDEAVAAQHYRALREIEPGDRDTLAALDRLATRAERWQELAEVLQARCDVENEAAVRMDVSQRLGSLYADVLQDLDAARVEFARVLEWDAGQPQAIAALEQILSKAPEQADEVSRLLEQAYEHTGRYDRLAVLLRGRLERTKDEDEQQALRLRLAEINASKLGDVAGAYGELEAAFLAQPSDTALWERLSEAAEEAQQHAALAVSFARAIDMGSLTEGEAAELAARVARLYDVVLAKPEEAEPYHLRVLAADALDDKAFHALKELYTNLERWEDLQALYRARIRETADAPIKLELLLQVCFLFEEILDKPDLAIDAYEQVVELEPEHGPSLRALERLYERRARWRDLSGLLRRQLDQADGQEAIELMSRLGELHEAKLGEPETAVDYVESVLQQAPTHLRAQQALERLLSVETQRQRIAAILEPLYESQGAYAELARILEIRLEGAGNDAEKVDVLVRLGELQEQRLHDAEAAFAAYARAVERDAVDERPREELGRLAHAMGRHRARAEVLEKALVAAEATQDAHPRLQSELLLELARVWRDDVGENDAAERCYERLLALAPDDSETVLTAARALERIHVEKRDHARLAQDLRLQVQFEPDEMVCRSLLIRLAELLEAVLTDIPDAIATHRQRLARDPEDLDAMVSLERLLERQAAWRELIEVLRLRDAVTVDASERRSIALRIGGLYEEVLEEPEEAIQAYTDALAAFGPDREVLAALVRLYEATQRWPELLETLLSDLELVDEPGARCDVEFRAAELMRMRMADIEGSLDLYARVLEVQPTHTGALSALDAVMRDASCAFRTEAARIATPRYEGAAAADKLLGCLEVLAEAEDVPERLQALRRAAEVADTQLNDVTRAFGYISQAVRLGAGEPDVAALLDELQRLAEASGRYADYVTVLQEAESLVVDGDLQLALYERVAETARHTLHDAALARTYYTKVREHQPEHAGALDALEALMSAAGDHAALIEVLQAKTELARDAAERHALLLRQADIFERALGNGEAAITALEEVANESDAQEPFVSLERLYAAAGQWTGLVGLYEQQLERGLGAESELHYKAGLCQLERLQEPMQAIEHFRASLASDGVYQPTIEVLERMLAGSEQRGLAAEILEPVYFSSGHWSKLTTALDARYADEPDVEERKRLLVRLAQVAEDQLEDFRAALDTYARLFKEDPRDEGVWDILARLAKHLDAWPMLADIYDGVLRDEGVIDPSMARLAMNAARLYGGQIGRLDRAAELYEAVLELDPADRRAFEALESVHLRQRRFEPLLKLYRDQADLAERDEHRIELLHKLARIHEDALEDAASAIDVYREVLDADASDPLAMDSLDRLLVQTERWGDLADHLRHRIADGSGASDEVVLRHRLGELLAHKLNDTPAAIDAYEEVVRIAPHHEPTVQALEVLVQAPEHTLRITEILEPIYRAQDQWKKLIAIHEAQIELSDGLSDRVALLTEVAQLHEQRGQDLALALHAWARAFVIEPDNDEVRTQLDRVAAEREAWDELVAVYEQGLRGCDDTFRIAALLAVIARLHDERRGDPRSAIHTYERMLQNDPSDRSPLDALEALHTLMGDWRGLVDVLQRKVEQSLEPAERAELLRRTGSIFEELLGDRQGAIAAYTHAIDEDETDAVSYEALDRLYQALGDAPRLFDVLKHRISLSEAPEERVQLGLRLGRLAEEQLRHHREAIEAYQGVVDDEPGHSGATVALARLYEREAMWPELLDNLRQRAGMIVQSAERAACLHRAGEVLERELDDVSEAITLYQEAIESDPAHEPAIEALLRISRLDAYRESATEILEPLLTERGRWNELAQVIERTVQGTTDPFVLRQLLRRLAEVHENGRGDLDAAFTALGRALAEEPADTETADDLERLAGQLQAWERLADTFGARASSALDPVAACALYRRLGRIAEDTLNDEARAIEAYCRASEHAGDATDLLGHLDRLYVRTEQWQSLCDILDRRVGLSVDAAERTALLVRLAGVREQHFGDGPGAFAVYEEVLAQEPDHIQALQGLERLVEHPELTDDVVGLLESAYRNTGASDKLVWLYDVRIQRSKEDSERLPLLLEAAKIWEEALGDASHALDALRQAFLIDPEDDSLLERVEALAAQGEAWHTLRGMVEQVGEAEAHASLSASRRSELNLRAAGWYRERLGDEVAAEQALRAAITADPEAQAAHAQLVDLLRGSDRPEDLMAALCAWCEVDSTADEQRERLCEAASIAETKLADVDLAAETFARAWRLDESDLRALEDVLRLRSAQGRWSDVAMLLHRRIEAEADPGVRREHRFQLADLQRVQLEDLEAAASCYESVLEEEPHEPRALEGLEAIYEQEGRWDSLRLLLDRKLDVATTNEERVGVRVRLARLAEQRFGDADGAIEQLREILAEQPGHAEVVEALRRLLSDSGRWQDVADLYWQQIELLAAAGDVPGELGGLERLGALYVDKLGSPDQAVAVYERMLARDAEQVTALRALATLHEQAEAWELAYTALERLCPLQIGPEASETVGRMIRLAQERLADPARTQTALQLAHALDPSDSQVGDMLKRHYRTQRQFAPLTELLTDEEQRIEDPAHKVAALRELAELYETELADAAAAVDCLERAVALVPEDREALLPLCDLYVKAGRQRDAIAVLERIIASFGGRRAKEVAVYEHRLGNALESMGDQEAALQHYDAAFRIDLTNVAILRDLGSLCLQRGDLDRAQKSFRALLLQKLGPEAGIAKADVYYQLGRIAEMQGDKVKAKSMLERALSESRGHAEAEALLMALR